jgi:hypothetical protein
LIQEDCTQTIHLEESETNFKLYFNIFKDTKRYIIEEEEILTPEDVSIGDIMKKSKLKNWKKKEKVKCRNKKKNTEKAQ